MAMILPSEIETSQQAQDFKLNLDDGSSQPAVVGTSIARNLDGRGIKYTKVELPGFDNNMKNSTGLVKDTEDHEYFLSGVALHHSHHYENCVRKTETAVWQCFNDRYNVKDTAKKLELFQKHAAYLVYTRVAIEGD